MIVAGTKLRPLGAGGNGRDLSRPRHVIGAHGCHQDSDLDLSASSVLLSTAFSKIAPEQFG